MRSTPPCPTSPAMTSARPSSACRWRPACHGAGGQQQGAGAQRAGADRAGQGQAWVHHLRLGRAGHLAAHGRRTVPGGHRHAVDARAVPRQRAGHHGPAGRPDRHGHRDPARAAAAGRQRQDPAAGRDHAHARRRIARAAHADRTGREGLLGGHHLCPAGAGWHAGRHRGQALGRHAKGRRDGIREAGGAEARRRRRRHVAGRHPPHVAAGDCPLGRGRAPVGGK